MSQNVHAKVNSANLTIVINFNFVIVPCRIYKYVVQLFIMQSDRLVINTDLTLAKMISSVYCLLAYDADSTKSNIHYVYEFTYRYARWWK